MPKCDGCTCKPADYCLDQFAGIKLPRSIRFLDLRDNGLHSDLKGDRYAGDACHDILGIKTTSPISVSGYCDMRDPYNKAELSKIVKHLRNIAAEYWRDYRKAKRYPSKPGEGGGAYYLPKAIYVTNYGGALVCDAGTEYVRRFEYNVKPT
jgi:hypothetical protein